MKTTKYVEVEEKEQCSASANFDQLFKQISPEDIDNHFNVFTLAAKEFYAITAGKENHYNSMIGSGSFGVLMKKPVNWSFIRADRYTLELMQKEQTYTLSYFPDEYKKQMLFLGSKSGRDSEKMRETQLTSVQTPFGNMAFKEARIIFECRLMILTTVSPNDIYSPEVKDYVSKEYSQEEHYRKIAFGEITNVWVKKNKPSAYI